MLDSGPDSGWNSRTGTRLLLTVAASLVRCNNNDWSGVILGSGQLFESEGAPGSGHPAKGAARLSQARHAVDPGSAAG